MTMHEYISQFTRLVGHAYKIKPIDSGSHLLATQFIQRIPSLHIKNKLRFWMSKMKSDLVRFIFLCFARESETKNKRN